MGTFHRITEVSYIQEVSPREREKTVELAPASRTRAGPALKAHSTSLTLVPCALRHAVASSVAKSALRYRLRRHTSTLCLISLSRCPTSDLPSLMSPLSLPFPGFGHITAVPLPHSAPVLPYHTPPGSCQLPTIFILEPLEVC